MLLVVATTATVITAAAAVMVLLLLALLVAICERLSDEKNCYVVGSKINSMNS
jgi:hypothetical protein